VTVAGDRKLRDFISYSRKDKDFAQEPVSGPTAGGLGFEPYLDNHHIAAGRRQAAGVLFQLQG